MGSEDRNGGGIGSRATGPGHETNISAWTNELLYIRTLIKTQDYLDVFARFKQKENIEAVEQMLASHLELELFERSQLGIHYRCLTR